MKSEDQSKKQLDDNKTVHYYKINDYAVLKVRPALYKIVVGYLDEASVEMNVNAYEKLSDVAVRIGERMILDPKKFAIQHMGRFLRGSSTVGANGIGDGSTLEVVVKRTKGGIVQFSDEMVIIT
ncbi:hypothetical protein FCM35_KLT06658 [Carex littledalei]|uniref:Ubiquitin-like domain-containing protein n=1 Tax=Carex littledalei TaxID=544730 RepID=A0A833QXU8_9POAL|nr:hypothetical protein FCM35_KLT06658 [Carex littledalei]